MAVRSRAQAQENSHEIFSVDHDLCIFNVATRDQRQGPKHLDGLDVPPLRHVAVLIDSAATTRVVSSQHQWLHSIMQMQMQQCHMSVGWLYRPDPNRRSVGRKYGASLRVASTMPTEPSHVLQRRSKCIEIEYTLLMLYRIHQTVDGMTPVCFDVMSHTICQGAGSWSLNLI
jgi:hypothetical protein